MTGTAGPGKPSNWREIALLAVAAVAIGWTFAHPSRPAPGLGVAPTPLPARLDPGFLTDLERLAPRIPAGAAVGLAVPEGATRVSSWYWTMAAFSFPAQVWRPIERRGPGFEWALAPRELAVTAPWRREACGRGWCLWRP
jgi:hypothetical protein